MNSLIRGIKGPFKGLGYLMNNPRLLLYVIIPFSITLTVYALVFYFMFRFGDEVMEWVTGTILWTPSQDEGILGAISNWLWEAARWLIVGMLYIASIILALLIFTTTANLIASPFYDILSEKIEEKLTGKNLPPFNLKAFIRHSIKLVLTMAKRYLLLIILIIFSLVLQFIPVFGSLASFFIAAFFAMDEYFDYPFGRYEVPVATRYKFFLKNFFHILGFGAAAVGFLLIPLVGLIVIPGNVVYATMVYVNEFARSDNKPIENK